MNFSTMPWSVWMLMITLFNVTGQPQASQKWTAYAHWTETPVMVDGRLSEPASEQTVVRVLFDAQKLYIGFECFDS